MTQHLIHTHGDLILVMATDGQVRGYEVQASGDLVETRPATALAMRDVRGGQGDFDPGAPRDAIDDDEFDGFNEVLRSAREGS